jgi:hypothetical protein
MGEWGVGQHDGKGGYRGQHGLETREEAEIMVKELNEGRCGFFNQRDVEEVPYVVVWKGKPA